MRKVLIVKLGAIGDVVMTLPAVRRLYDGGAEIDWICGRAVRPLLDCYPWVNVLVADEGSILRGNGLERFRALGSLWRLLVGKRYDLCATLYYDRRYKILTAPVGAKRKIFLSRDSRETRLIPGRHHADEYARILLNRVDSVEPESVQPVRPSQLPSVVLAARARECRIGLVPGGASNMLRQQTLRRWPIEMYGRLAQMLVQGNHEVVLLGGPDDIWVRSHFVGIPVADWIGQLSLPEVIAACDSCDVVVSHDTGPMHLAGLSGASLVALFGPTDPGNFAPKRQNVTVIEGGLGFACRPCYDGRDFAPCLHNDCMRQITPELVLREVDALLESRRQAADSPYRVVVP